MSDNSHDGQSVLFHHVITGLEEEGLSIDAIKQYVSSRLSDEKLQHLQDEIKNLSPGGDTYSRGKLQDYLENKGISAEQYVEAITAAADEFISSSPTPPQKKQKFT